MGPALSTGMGPVTITQGEIQAWQWNNGIRLSAWEVRTIRRMSAEWIAESRRAAAQDAKAPYVNPASEEYRRDVLPGRIRGMLREK